MSSFMIFPPWPAWRNNRPRSNLDHRCSARGPFPMTNAFAGHALAAVLRSVPIRERGRGGRGAAAHSLPLVHEILLQSHAGRALRARVRTCGMAMAETDDAKTPDRFGFRALAARLRAWRDDDSDRSIAQRIASG